MSTPQLNEILRNLSDNEELKNLIDQEAYLVPSVQKNNRAWDFFIEVCKQDERRVFGMSAGVNILPMIVWMRKLFGDILVIAPPEDIVEKSK